ncbi:AmmeMemoRadiSam system protein B [Candidatus Uhrbacteria bacterium]|nr:AmmeMemoRadiSam system protein B [Candidatus Uhrbacteria bacterium]
MSIFVRGTVHRLCLFCTLLVLIFLSGIVIGGSTKEKTASQSEPGSDPVFSYGYAAMSLYERANETASEVERTGAGSAIVAHHLLVADKIAQVFAALGNGKEKIVVILSPNHFSAGRSALQTTYGSWTTPFGDVEVDSQSVDALTAAVPDLSIEPETFRDEHGVSAITPFVKTWFPNAKLVPLVIHDKATDEEVAALASTIQDELPWAIVIASIDMSHYLPRHIQEYHDAVTMRSIAQGSADFDLEIDANDVLQTLFEVNRLRGDRQWVQTHHGNSLAMGATSDWRENTSHVLGYFLEGDSTHDPFVSLQFVGDVMLDRGVRIKIEEQGADYPWENVTRYLQGSQLRIANLEGAVSERESQTTEDPPFMFTFAPESVEAMKPFIDVVSLANNHSDDFGAEGEQETRDRLAIDLGIDWFGGSSRSDDIYRYDLCDQSGCSLGISLIGFNQFGFLIPDLTPIIESEDQAGRFVIVMPHWGEEYITAPSDSQREMAQAMIDAGADLIVGAHPHVVQGVDVIDNTPVIYSLGNFIFDQGFGETSCGMTLGVILDRRSVTLYLSPISTLNGQPTPMSDKDAKQLFLDRNISTNPLTIFYDEPPS